jgi:hypothetical protein
MAIRIIGSPTANAILSLTVKWLSAATGALKELVGVGSAMTAADVELAGGRGVEVGDEIGVGVGVEVLVGSEDSVEEASVLDDAAADSAALEGELAVVVAAAPLPATAN